MIFFGRFWENTKMFAKYRAVEVSCPMTRAVAESSSHPKMFSLYNRRFPRLGGPAVFNQPSVVCN